MGLLAFTEIVVDKREEEPITRHTKSIEFPFLLRFSSK